MPLFVSPAYVDVLFDRVVRMSAARIGILNTDWCPAPELLQAIHRARPDVGAYILAYYGAYDAWFQVHVDIERRGLAGNLDPLTHIRLTEAISARDQTEAEFLASLP